MMASSTTSEPVEYTARRKPERSSFSQTCSLLSQYLKEKGSFAELSLGMAHTPVFLGSATNQRKTTTRRTMNLFPGAVEAPTTDSDPARTLLRSMDLLPQYACHAPCDSRVADVPVVGMPQPSQMTIFYGGQAIVFEDFPSDKAREIMLLAGQGSVPSQPMSSGFNTIPIQVQPNTPSIASDLPLARRASLHRFLEKRKDRITSKAPYQIDSPMASSSMPEMENRAWLGLAAP